MICVKCFHGKTDVANSRPHKTAASIWRRRRCQRCGHVFTTTETPVLSETMSVDGQPFSQPELLVELAGLLSHRGSTTPDDASWLTETIIQHLWAQKKTTLSRLELIQTTYEVLNRFDAVAGIRYGSQHGLVDTTRQTPRRGRPRISRL